MASPAATGSDTRNSRMSSGAKIPPRIPVNITATTVIGTIPPAGSAMLTAIGVVTDFGKSDTVRLSSSPNSRHNRYTLPMDAAEPAAHPIRIGSQYCFRI